MSTTRKVAIGIGLAGGAILAAWLLTGDRKQKTREFIVKKANDLKQMVKKQDSAPDDTEATYV